MYLGFDTSNYTTSVALFDGNSVIQSKMLLQVKEGERGLRQSEALFQHTVNIPNIISELDFKYEKIEAVAVSTRPRNVENSYMPCFLAGKSSAVAVSKFCNSPLYETSHQVGHIIAALYSVERLDLIDKPFIAFHLSGGTTEALIVNPDKNEIIKADIVAQSLDLKAGQAIDRAGVLMGLKFPCGAELDRLSCLSNKEFTYKPTFKGMDCSLSGVENKVKSMINSGASNEDVSKFTLLCITLTISEMVKKIRGKYPNLPIIFSGGVSSNSMLKNYIKSNYNDTYFASPQYSCDNAAGIAIYAFLKDKHDSNYSITSQ